MLASVFLAEYITIDQSAPSYGLARAGLTALGYALFLIMVTSLRFSGARMFVLAQSLSMMRRVEGFEPVVQALLANTSTQAFFSPDPEDAEIIRDTLNATARFGITTQDLPTLTCWLRARLNYAWQPPTLLKVKPLKRPDPGRVQKLIREVIGAHPEDYVSGDLWQKQSVDMLKSMLSNPTQQSYLDELFHGVPKNKDSQSLDGQKQSKKKKTKGSAPEDPSLDDRELGM